MTSNNDNTINCDICDKLIKLDDDFKVISDVVYISDDGGILCAKDYNELSPEFKTFYRRESDFSNLDI